MDSSEILERDSGNSKRRLFGSFAWENGWSLSKTVNGTVKCSVRTDDAFDGTTNLICSRWKFNSFWDVKCPNVRIRKALVDILHASAKRVYNNACTNVQTTFLSFL